jgi:hypothetical protein
VTAQGLIGYTGDPFDPFDYAQDRPEVTRGATGPGDPDVDPQSDLRGDFLVIGSGIAGLRAALSLAETGDVVILTKADPRESNTGYAQGGIAAAIGADD